MSKEEPAVGIPYAYPAPTNPPPYQQQHYYTVGNPHQAGIIPSNAIYGDPKGIPIQQTIFRDTPAPFSCAFCGESGLTNVRPVNKSEQTLAFMILYCQMEIVCKHVRSKESLKNRIVENYNPTGKSVRRADKYRSKPSLAAVVGCMMPFMLGFCFLCPGMDCLWHKYHYCPDCGQKVADFEKNDPCLVVDAPHWIQESFALPA